MLGSKTETRLPIGILRILTISPFTEMLGTDILARCLGVPRTSVLSAFSVVFLQGSPVFKSTLVAVYEDVASDLGKRGVFTGFSGFKSTLVAVF